MKDDWLFWRACGDKWPFEHRRDARHLAKVRSRQLGERLTVYRCTFCARYHIGHDRHEHDWRQAIRTIS